jgi:hypothetical protein
MTSQSDFFRLQFRGFARIEGNQWQHYANDDARFHTTYNCAWVRGSPQPLGYFRPQERCQLHRSLCRTGLDTFLFAQTIAWVKGIYPDYAINPGMIAITGNASEEEKLRRNAFYASQGFQFDWQDAAQRTGLYFKDKISRLLGVWDKSIFRKWAAKPCCSRWPCRMSRAWRWKTRWPAGVGAQQHEVCPAKGTQYLANPDGCADHRRDAGVVGSDLI